MPNDDQRAAVGFSITLSGQLIASAMATLAVEAAYVWYALGSRQPRAGFIFFGALTALLVAISIVSAGKGITKARDAGFSGNWNLLAGKKHFNSQAIFLLLALATLGITFSLGGPSRESAVEKRLNDLQIRVALLDKEFATESAWRLAASQSVATCKSDIDLIRKQVDSLSNERDQADRFEFRLGRIEAAIKELGNSKAAVTDDSTARNLRC